MSPRLRIISVNDVYTLDNLPRLATLVRAHRLPAPDVTITVIAGDFVAPSLLSSLDAGHGMVDCLNAVGLDYATLGNHEDDIPPAELHRRVAEFRGAWLSTNVDFDPAMPRDAIVRAGTHGVGLVAVLDDDPTLYRAAPFGGAAVRAPQASALEGASALRARGCDTVVALTHQSIVSDRALARTGAFPLIVGGHEHVPFMEQVGSTWIVKAGCDATAAVISELAWDDAGAPTVTVTRVPVLDFEEDAAIRARVDGHLAKVRAISEATIVTTGPGRAPLSSVGTRVRQTTMGTLLCSRMRACTGADVAVLNGGGIRANREYPERFTFGDLEAEVPFSNEVVVVTMPAGVLQTAVAASRARAPVESGGFLQVDPDVAPFAADHEIKVAIVRELFFGMDHNETLMAFAAAYPARIPPAHSGQDIKHVLAHAFACELWLSLGGFDALDVDRDGVVREDEIYAALSRISAEAPAHVTAHLLARLLDRNGDLAVSRGEVP